MISPRSGAALTALLRITPKRRKKIVVHSVPDFEDGALAVLDELLARGHKPLVLLERTLPQDPNVSDLAKRGVTFAEKKSARGRLHYLIAETVFTTHGPFRMHPAPANQRVVYLGHGEPLAKSAGYWYGERARAPGATVAIASSTIGKAIRCVQQGLRPQQVLLVGAPRNDRLLRSDRERMRRALADWLPDGTSTMFIWLPTFRRSLFGASDGTDQRTAMPLDLESLQKVDRWLATNRAAILVKPHPLSRPYPAEAFERIRTIDEAALRSSRLSLCSLLAAADCLITDASSVWVDFLLLDRPLICCFPDLDEYRNSRSLNLEPYDEWFPGPFVTNADELLDELARVVDGADPHAEKREWLTRALHLHRDGNASPRLLDALGL
jgi:CDP-glycerol glycerophosphotransferase